MKKTNPVRKGLVQGMASKVNARLLPLIKLVEQKRHSEIVHAARELLKTLPTHPYVLKALSFGLIGQGEYDLACPVLEQAIRQSPKDSELHNNLGICLSATLRGDEALVCFDRALSFKATDPEIWKNRGSALCLVNRWNDAIPCLVKAVELFPGDDDEAIDKLAGALLNADRVQDALACYSGLLEIEPDNAGYLGSCLYAGLRQCHWDSLNLNVNRLRDLSVGFNRPSIAPFHAMSVPGLTALELRSISEVNARNTVSPSVFSQPPLVDKRGAPKIAGQALRVGYLSYDFKDHPVANLLPQVLEFHDRNRLEVFGYSMGPDDGSDIRKRLICAFDQFVDISRLGIESSAKRIFDDGIDILVDLQGWTTGERASMLALRPAPIQVNWLGYAGTIGSNRFADYLLGDPIVTPYEHAAYYAEQIVHMPHCYLPIDATQGLLEAPSRKEAGLPETGFVFCSLNNAYKLNPQVFDVWCKLLLETPESCLWLIKPPGGGADNLLREAATRGVAAERIVFASYVKSRESYLARLQLADLALDPSPYNSHSSGMDFLWAGVPMVTLLGDTFPGRVGASLVTAAGLSECVTHSWGEYLTLCLELYRNTEKLGILRQRLMSGRQTAPLFDMAGFAHDLETVYSSLYERYLAKKDL